MEANICDINHIDADVLLPPRKRLLAGYKKQSSDGNGNYDSGSHQPMVASSSSPSSSSSSEFARLNNLLNSSNLSNEEIAKLAKSAASAASKAAQEARAAAEEKAAIATKAITAVKNALALVDSFNEEPASKEKSPRKNKLKKHVPVQLLYKKPQTAEDSNTDEELARRLHRAMNSSPRITKNVSSSEVKGKHKKPKSSSVSEKTRVPNGSIVFGGNPACTSSGHAAIANVNSGNEDSIREVYAVKVDEKESRYEKTHQLELENEEAEPSLLKEKNLEETNSYPGKRRGRLKLKKLPLSSCTSRDRENPKEDMITKATPLTDKNMGNPAAGSRRPLFPLEPSDAAVVLPVEATPTWKCQEFKAPACVKQNKVIQS